MLKMFRDSDEAASSGEFWDENWLAGGDVSLRDADRVCESQPMFPVLRDTLRSDRLFLEGGCGPAHWVRYFHERGYRTVGIDFAEETVARVHSIASHLPVRVGNVLGLPFSDGEVHTYYSGGVVEHFEEGPGQALREARRVIADDGWFLCSVPDVSWVRAALNRRDENRFDSLEPPLTVRKVARTEREPAPAGASFFQYVFTEREFAGELGRAGFRVERTFGYSVIWALMEVPGFKSFYDRVHRTLSASTTNGTTTSAMATGASAVNGARSGLKEFIHRVVNREDPTVPILGPFVRMAREVIPNMRMYVARPG